MLDALQGLRGTYARPSGNWALPVGEKVTVGGRPTGWVLYQRRRGRRCVATLWVDGQERDPEVLHEIRPDDVEAVEIYDGSESPGRFWNARRDSGTSRCGAVVLWLRRPVG